MKIFKNIIYIIFISNFLFGGTFYFSKSLDELSEIRANSTSSQGEKFGFRFKANEDKNRSHTYSVGYYHQVWKKRKSNYGVSLGLEYVKNNYLNYTSFYSMFNYYPTKNILSSFILGTNFFKVEDGVLVNDEDYYPSTKGGLVWGVVFSYLIENIPISLEHKVYTHSYVYDDRWVDARHSITSVSIVYKF